jgi:hypothetical protein
MRGVWWGATSSITTTVRLNSAIGYVTPKEMLAGRQQENAERDRKLQEARKQRQIRRRAGCVKNEERHSGLYLTEEVVNAIFGRRAPAGGLWLWSKFELVGE